MNAVAEAVQIARGRQAARSGDAGRIRLAAGLSQAEIARAVGVTASAVSQWEAGNRRPRGDTARRYAHLIDVLATLDTTNETPRAA